MSVREAEATNQANEVKECMLSHSVEWQVTSVMSSHRHLLLELSRILSPQLCYGGNIAKFEKRYSNLLAIGHCLKI